MKAKKFLIRLLLFSIPFLLAIAFYILYDPFKVVRSYDSYYLSGRPAYISLNKDHVSTENWLNHYPGFHYDSYIFGNSRSMFYQVDAWRQYTGSPRNKCYHFDASGESIYGIAKKVEFLRRQGADIKNCLIVMDFEALNQANNSAGHIFMKDPHLSGGSSFDFQIESMKAFFDFKFLTAFIDFKLSGRVKDYMKQDFLLDDRPVDYDYITNEIQAGHFDTLIKKDPERYYSSRQNEFPRRDSTPHFAPQVIKAPQIALLRSIKEIFVEKKTNYKIVLSPLYNQSKTDPGDVRTLQEIFGAGNVFDFSGINEFTSDFHNYYEWSHYRPPVANEIMKIIYTGRQ
jgi:hypothetical protein